MTPAAKQGDRIVAVDTHMCGGAPVLVSFDGRLVHDLSPNVVAEHRPLALRGSVAINDPPHVPPPGPAFDVPPTNRAVIVTCSATVRANHRPLARHGDAARTCNDPIDLVAGTIVAGGTVLVGP